MGEIQHSINISLLHHGLNHIRAHEMLREFTCVRN